MGGMCPLRNLAIVLLGIVALAAYSSYLVRPIFKRFSWRLVAPPDGIDRSQWLLATEGVSYAGMIIGYLESVLVFFVGILLSYETAGYVVAGCWRSKSLLNGKPGTTS